MTHVGWSRFQVKLDYHAVEQEQLSKCVRYKLTLLAFCRDCASTFGYAVIRGRAQG